jgi:hypothetical protein
VQPKAWCPAWTAIHLRPVTFIAMKTDAAATLRRVYAMSLAGVYPHYVAKEDQEDDKRRVVVGRAQLEAREWPFVDLLVMHSAS